MNPLLSAVDRKLKSVGDVPIQLVMPDGTALGSSDPRVKFVVRNKKALVHLAEGSVGVLGQDYVEGLVDIQGTMRDVMAAASRLLSDSPIDEGASSWATGFVRKIISIWRHSIERDAKQIEFHYDLSEEFYALWQDPHRVYSCAYYRTPEMNLAQAQEAKLDHICRKLRLAPGERFLDIGAGWGGLLLWAAENYGVDATGITLSRNQHAHVNRLIQEKGLSGRVRMELLDYRKLDESQPFDKISSVGMFEHVGRALLPEYFAKLRRLLKPGGLIMNHGITSGGVYNAEVGSGMGQFIDRYIFPGGELTHASNVLQAVALGGLETVDMENLRPHYARTLWAWSDALESQLDRAAEILTKDKGEQGMKSLRAYRLYLAGCAMGFEHGWISLHQFLLAPLATGRSDELDYPADLSFPWRRDYMYDGKQKA
ncbi:MAG TPA: class I SAM-dependent methyltransferase [Bordetella sp.]